MKPLLNAPALFLIRAGLMVCCALVTFSFRVYMVDAQTPDLKIAEDPYYGERLFFTHPSLGPDWENMGHVTAPGVTSQVDLVIENAGTGSAGPFTVDGLHLDYAPTIMTHLGGDGVPDYTIPFSSNVVPGLLPGETATVTGTWTVPDDAPLGKYWLRWDIDSLNEVNELDETNNESINIFPTGPAGWDLALGLWIINGECQGETLRGGVVALDPEMGGGCVMPTTNAFTTQAGSCEAGFTGNCSLFCGPNYNGVYSISGIDPWMLPTPSGDVGSCTALPPPVIDTFEVCTQDGLSCANEGATLTTDLGTALRIAWSSTNTDLCTAVSGVGFNTGNAVSGVDATGMAAGDSPLYRIACNMSGDTPTESTVYVSTNATLPTLSSSATIVRSGTTVRLSWNTNNGDETLCTLSGAGIEATDILNGTGNAQDGYVDVAMNGRTTFTLDCGVGGLALKTVEIIPVSWE